MTTCKLVMPGDMNHYGFLFGGKMLMWVDEVAWIAVSEDYPTLHFVTVGMSEVKFKKSVHPKSVLRFETQRQALGRTSVTYHVDVFCRQIESRDEELVFSTDITFVCVDANGAKTPIEPQRTGGVGRLERIGFKPQRTGETGGVGRLDRIGSEPQRTGETGGVGGLERIGFRPQRTGETGGEEMTEEQQKLIGREFRHFKGNLYRIEGFAKNSETLEEMVVYRALYGEHGLWVRPAKMFFETIERDGKQMKRFEPL